MDPSNPNDAVGSTNPTPNLNDLGGVSGMQPETSVNPAMNLLSRDPGGTAQVVQGVTAAGMAMPVPPPAPELEPLINETPATPQPVAAAAAAPATAPVDLMAEAAAEPAPEVPTPSPSPTVMQPSAGPLPFQTPLQGQVLNSSSGEPPVEEPQNPGSGTPFWRHWWAAAIALLLLVGGVGAFALTQGSGNKTPTTSNPVSKNSGSYTVTSAPLSEIAKEGLTIDAGSQLAVNGQLRINDSAVIAGTDRPANPQVGQLWLDKNTNILYYYNGTTFAPMSTSISGTGGNIAVGSGVNLTSNTLVNTGVLTLQGQAGDVNLGAGGGIAINGTTITNTGVTGISGTGGQINVSAATGNVQLSIPNLVANGVVATDASGNIKTLLPGGNGLCLISNISTGIPEFGSCTGSSNVISLNPGDGGGTVTGLVNINGSGGITVTSNGTDTITIATTAGGNVSSSGAHAAGTIALFSGINDDIANSTLVQTGSPGNYLVTLTGDLDVTGAISGDGAAITNLDAGNIATGTLGVARGGTGRSTFAQHGVLVGDNSNALNVVTASAAGQCFMSVSGADPVFQSCPVGGNVSAGNPQTPGRLTRFDTASNTIIDSIIGDDGAGTVTVYGNLTVANSGVLTGNGSGLTSVNAAQLNGQSAAFYQNAGNINAGTLAVNYGGTGTTSLTNHGILIGQGTSAPAFAVETGTSGLCLLSVSGADPSFQTCPVGGNVSSSGTHTAGTIALFNGTGQQIADSVLVQTGVSGSETVTVSGTTIIKKTSGTAFQIQDGLGAGDLFTADTSGGRVFIGQAPTAITDVTLQVKGGIQIAAGVANPAANPQHDGTIYYDPNGGGPGVGKFQIIEGGLAKTLCNTTNQGCGAGTNAITLQGAYNNGNGGITTETTASGPKNITFNLANSTLTADSNFLVDILAGSTGYFAVQNAGNDVFAVNTTGAVLGKSNNNDGQLVFNSSGTNFTTTIKSGTPTADYTLTLPNNDGNNLDCLKSNGSGVLSWGTCVSGGSGGGITGSGTQNTLAIFDSSGQALTDSIITQPTGTSARVTGTLEVTDGSSLVLGTSSAAGKTGAIVFKNQTNNNTTTLQSGVATSSISLTLPTATGSNGQCLGTTGGGVLVFQTCLSGGGSGGGVTDINGISGGVSLLGTSNQISVANNLPAAGDITLSLPQDIATSSNVQFGGLLLTGTSQLTLGNGTGQIGKTIFRDGSSGFTTTLSSTTLTADRILTIPNAGGTLAVSASGNIALSAAGNITFSGTLPVVSGGTGSTTSGGARTNLGAAASGANSDITSLTGLTSINNASAGLTIGNTGQALTLQGNASTTLTATSGLNTNSLVFAAPSGGSKTITLPNETGTVCTTGNVCTGYQSTISVLPIANGGTGSTTSGGARTNLGAAASGANSDITSLSGLTTALSVSQGGTGSTTSGGARTNLGAAASGANSDITSLTGLTTALGAAYGGTGVNGSSALSGQLLIGNGSGYTLSTLTAGSGISIINSPGGIQIVNSNPGGTCAGCANTALSNLSAVQINAALQATNGTGTNAIGTALTLAGGQGTGTAVGGDINFQVAKASGVSGSSLNTLSTALSISGTNGAAVFQNVANSTAALQVKDLSGTEIFSVDTTNAKIGTVNQTAASTNSRLLSVQTGDASGTTSTSGALTVASGTGTGGSGALSLASGNVSAGTSGTASLQSGTGTTSTGAVTVASGSGTSASGNVTVSSGAVSNGTSGTHTSSTGNVTTGTSGANTVSTGTGSTGSGILTLQSGSASAAASGAVILQSGGGTTGTGTAQLLSGNATSGVSGALTVKSGTGTTGTGNLTISTGNSTSNSSTSGNITVDTGTVGAGGTSGTISIGTTNATNVTVGNATAANTVTLQSGTGGIAASSTTASGTGFGITTNSLTTGTGLNVGYSNTASSKTSGNLVNVQDAATYTAISTNTSSSLNVSRTTTTNISQPAITFDAFSNNSTGLSTWSHTVGNSLTNSILVVMVTGSPTVTYNGTALTYYGSEPIGGWNIWYMLNPPSGAHNIVLSGTLPAVATSWSNVDQSSPISAIGGANGFAPQTATVTTTTSDVVVDAARATTIGGASCSTTLTSSQTTLFTALCNAGFPNRYSGSYKASSGSSTNMVWNTSVPGSDSIILSAIALKRSTTGITQTGSAAQISSNCVTTAGSCTDSSNVLSLTQSYASATGAVLKIQNAGTGPDIQIGSSTTGQIQSAGGTSTNGINIQSGVATSTTSGGVTLQSGAGVTGTGTARLLSGDASGGTSGAVTVQSGTGTSGTGALTLASGAASAGSSGAVAVKSGTGTTGTGNLTINTGNSSTAGGTSGSITIDSGSTNAGTAGNIFIGNANALQVTVGNTAATLSSSWTNNTGYNLTVASVNQPRSMHRSVVYNGYIYVVGGKSGTANSTAVTNVYYARLNADGTIPTTGTGIWASTTSLPGKRIMHSLVASNGYMYAIGGMDGSSVVQTTSYYAKINADGTVGTWNTTTALGTALNGHGAIAANGYIYILGGSTTSAATGAVGTVYSARQNANGTLSSWTTLTAMGVNRYGAGVTYANGYVYVVGGVDATPTYLATVYYAKLNTDGTVGSWSTTSSVVSGGTQARAYAQAVVANGNMYFLGGTADGTVSNSGVYSSPIAQDGTLTGWSTLASLPEAVYNQSVVVANGYFYKIGGFNNTGSATYNTVYYNSAPRVKVGGNLDLIGSNNSGLVEGNAGGQLTAGNTRIVGTFDVSDQANFAQGVSIGGNLSVGGRTSNSTSAFVVQNTNGATLLNVDSASNNVNLLSNGSVEQDISGNWTGLVATVTQDSTQQFLGLFSAKVVTNSTVTNEGLRQNITLSNSTQYALSFMAKLDGASNTFNNQLIAGYHNGTSFSGCTLNSTTVLSTGWTKYYCTFTSPSSSSGTPYILIGSADGGGGRTFYVDAVQLNTGSGAYAFQDGLINLAGVISGPTSFRNQTDSTAGFQIQSSSGATLLTADTLNGTIVAGISATTGTGMSVASNSLTTGNALSVSSSSGSITSGNLAVVSQTSNYTTTNTLSGNSFNVNRSITNTGTSSQPSSDATPANSSHSASSAWTNSVTPASSNTNKLLVAHVFTKGTQTISSIVMDGTTYNAPFTSGTAPLIKSYSFVNSASLTVTVYDFYKPVTTNTAKSVTVNWSAGATGTMSLQVYKDVSQSTPVGSAPSTGSCSSGTCTNASNTAGVANDLILDDVVVDNDWTFGSNMTSLTPGTSPAQTQVYSGSIAGTYFNIFNSMSTRIATSGTTQLMTNTYVPTWALDGNMFAFSIKGALSGTTVTGAATQITSNCTVNGGSCTDTSNVLNLTQSYASASGAVLQIQNSGTGSSIQGGDGSGTNVAGNALTIAGGIGTGTGVGGNLNFQIAKAGSSGSTLNTLATVLSISGTNGSVNFQNATDSTTALTVKKQAGGTAILTVDTSNSRVCINTATCNNALGVTGNVVASGSITGSGTPDLAETITASADVTAGDVVSANPNDPESVVKSTVPYDKSTLGVISDGTSTFMINAHANDANAILNGKPLVLAGRVPVKVTNEGGDIHPGDFLTSSSTPGYAMKANSAGPTIGKALASFSGASGTVMLLVGNAYYDPVGGNSLQSQSGNFNDLNVAGAASVGSLVVTGSASFHGNILVNGHIVTGGGAPSVVAQAGAGAGADVSIDGNDIAGTITVIAGSGGAAGDLAQLQFNTAYNKAPRVIISPSNDSAAGIRAFRGATTSTSFMLNSKDAPVAGQAYQFDYFIIQ